MRLNVAVSMNNAKGWLQSKLDKFIVAVRGRNEYGEYNLHLENIPVFKIAKILKSLRESGDHGSVELYKEIKGHMDDDLKQELSKFGA